LVFQAAADEIWTVYADSTLAGQFGYLVTFADEDNTGTTIFLSTEEGHRRFVAHREFGTEFWQMFPEGSFVAPGPDDSVGSSWSTFLDDFDRPSTEHFEAVESFSGPAGNFTSARCVIRPNEEPETFTEVRNWVLGVGLVGDFFPSDGTDVLTSFNIVGGTGYFPLAIGNTWSYGFIDVLSPADDTPVSVSLLYPCAPNPFNPQTKISFEMGSDAHASLRIFDAAGRLVKTLVDEQRAAGPHTVTWNGRDVAGRTAAAGVYLYRFETGKSVQTRTMTLVK